jgi:hypothetical protein
VCVCLVALVLYAYYPRFIIFLVLIHSLFHRAFYLFAGMCLWIPMPAPALRPNPSIQHLPPVWAM